MNLSFFISVRKVTQVLFHWDKTKTIDGHPHVLRTCESCTNERYVRMPSQERRKRPRTLCAACSSKEGAQRNRITLAPRRLDVTGYN